MGCQRSISEQIVASDGDYVLTVKDNQPSLHKDIRKFFDYYKKHGFNKGYEFDIAEDIDKDHGRIEVRKCYVSNDLSWLKYKSEWPIS